MKVRVVFTVEVSDEDRMALGKNDKPATHPEIALYFEEHGTVRGNQLLQERVRDYYKRKAAFYAAKASEGATGAQGTG